jgi:hypothetical protein
MLPWGLQFDGNAIQERISAESGKNLKKSFAKMRICLSLRPVPKGTMEIS